MFQPSFLINRKELEANSAGIQGKIKSIANTKLSYTAYIPTDVDYCIVFYYFGVMNL